MYGSNYCRPHWTGNNVAQDCSNQVKSTAQSSAFRGVRPEGKPRKGGMGCGVWRTAEPHLRRNSSMLRTTRKPSKLAHLPAQASVMSQPTRGGIEA